MAYLTSLAQQLSHHKVAGLVCQTNASATTQIEVAPNDHFSLSFFLSLYISPCMISKYMHIYMYICLYICIYGVDDSITYVWVFVFMEHSALLGD